MTARTPVAPRPDDLIGLDGEDWVRAHQRILDGLPYGFPRTKPHPSPDETCSSGGTAGCDAPAVLYGRCPAHLPPSYCSRRGCAAPPARNGRCGDHQAGCGTPLVTSTVVGTMVVCGRSETCTTCLARWEDDSYMRRLYPAPYRTDGTVRRVGAAA